MVRAPSEAPPGSSRGDVATLVAFAETRDPVAAEETVRAVNAGGEGGGAMAFRGCPLRAETVDPEWDPSGVPGDRRRPFADRAGRDETRARANANAPRVSRSISRSPPRDLSLIHI